MNNAEILHFTSQALWLVLILSMPCVLVAAIVGTLVSLVQAVTQVQEQTLGFVAKLIGVVVVLFVTAGWMGNELHAFGELILNKIARVR
jgi:type III secretion protein S